MCTYIHRHSITSSFYTALNRLVKKLDSRIEKNERAGGFKSKTKVISSPSPLEPPLNAPQWAVVVPNED